MFNSVLIFLVVNDHYVEIYNDAEQFGRLLHNNGYWQFKHRYEGEWSEFGDAKFSLYVHAKGAVIDKARTMLFEPLKIINLRQ